MSVNREELEDVVRAIADAVRRTLDATAGPGVIGFVLMVYDFGERGSFAYAANARRADVVELLEEAIAKIRGQN